MSKVFSTVEICIGKEQQCSLKFCRLKRGNEVCSCFFIPKGCVTGIEDVVLMKLISPALSSGSPVPTVQITSTGQCCSLLPCLMLRPYKKIITRALNSVMTMILNF